MNKNLIAHMVAGVLLLGTSVASMAATNTVGSHQQTLGLSVTSGTCNVTWPTDVSFSVNSADTSVSNGAKVGDTQEAGSFILTGCPAKTLMKFAVQASNIAQGNIWQGMFTDTSGKAVTNIGYRLSATENFTVPWKLNGTEGNLGTTDENGDLTVPVYAGLVKRGSSTVNPGELSSVITYTISYD
ncbi:hypothetical protein RCM64_20580 [Escherichia marmotae]|uniref:fimbrial protein n=1 Tax=Escherichia marmotae TaxID=1499973 RepID=UPI002433A69A|nr:hypothetical protein [Escherichia marmotae]MED9092905.1 hypothetical protein [Escherichia marmotae]WFZ13252.1 hypothetical protein NFK54_15355 [Escherichia marmotae]